MLKLPKDVAADPRHDAVARLLATNARPLWEGGKNQAATLPLTDVLATELRAALAAEDACQGLETCADKLAAEQKGLDALRRKAPESPQNARVSRILFLADDGSTRFYRDADALLSRHPERLLACRLQVTGEALGNILLGNPRMVRCVLVTDKRAAARVLLALVPAG